MKKLGIKNIVVRKYQYQQNHGMIPDDYDNFQFQNRFSILILCCGKSPSSDCPGHHRRYWHRHGSL